MKPSLYICRSPLQLLNCIEACEQFGLRDQCNILVAAWLAECDRELMQRLIGASSRSALTWNRCLPGIIEIAAVDAETIPSAFIFFGSTAVDTLDIILRPLITIYRIPKDSVMPERRGALRGMYNNFLARNVGMVDLNTFRHREDQTSRSNCK